MIERLLPTGPLAHRPQPIVQNQGTQAQSTRQPTLWITKLQAPDISEITATKSEELWKKIQETLPDGRSQRLAYLLYYCGLKPREIITTCQQDFNDLQEIYRLRHNILELLLSHKIIPE